MDEQRVLPATTLIGDTVRNRHGQDLGKIEELMIDLATGRVAYAVLSFGGFLGIGDKLFAIPWEALERSATDGKLVLDVDKRRLQEAPGFDKNNWPDMANAEWGTEIYTYYGYRPYW